MQRGTLSVQVRSSQGIGAAGIDVSVTRLDAAVAPQLRTDDHGRLVLAGLAPGEYELRAPGAQPRVVVLGADRQADVELVQGPRRARITLRLLDSDAHAWRNERPGVWLLSGSVSQRSSYNTSKGLTIDVEPDTYSVAVPGNIVALPPTFEARAGEEAEVPLRLAVGTLRILRFEVEPACDRYWLRLLVRDERGDVVCDQRWRRRSASSGEFVPWFQCTAAFLTGSYTVEGHTDDGTRWSLPLTIRDLEPDERLLTVPRLLR
jgi:hypothetical protein